MPHTRLLIIIFILILSFPVVSRCGLDSYYASGVSFFRTADLGSVTDELDTRSLSPGLDSDFLLSFGKPGGSAYLAGFGFIWSKRTERPDDIPFSSENAKASIQVFALPITAGYVKRFSEPGRRGWAAGGLVHYYIVKANVDFPNPEEGDPSYFRIRSDNSAERDAKGPGVSAFAAYEYPFFLGRFGIGIKGRWTSLQTETIDGIGTPEIDLSGVTLYLSIALVD